ncbi:MAG: integration host factor subunit beta [Deltaproteobacteria bacterium]|nr:integration host factor subunit beta [Deltaproteobacteria bacterium]
MNKSELIDAVAKKTTGHRRADVEVAVSAIFASMANALTAEERVEVRGFGSFVVRHRKAREGRNPKTGAVVTIPPRRTPFFTVGKELRERVKAGRGKRG